MPEQGPAIIVKLSHGVERASEAGG